MKECLSCKTSKPLSEFRVSKRKDKSWHHNTCKECINKKYMEDYYSDHENRKEKLKVKARFISYGITDADFKLLLKKQNNSCAICQTEVPGGMGSWHVDHDHVTGKVRGLLCHCCNTGLGLFKDNELLLIKASNYLHESK